MGNLSEDSSDDAELIWQTAPTKRKRVDSPNFKQRKVCNMQEQPSTSSNNKYSVLDNEVENANQHEETPTAPKPPAIYIPNVHNINLMVKKLNSVIPNDFNFKSLREGQVRLMIKSVDSYRKCIKYLETEKINFHTYQLKQERAYRIVIKGLHPSTPVEDIKAELILLGHDVRSVRNAVSRVTKEPLSMFFVDLDPKPNNKTVYEIENMNHAVVKIEPPIRTNDLVQCHRCQQFGHTKSYCKKPFRCVKCGMDHASAQCTKTKDVPPRCAHCLENHTANYKGCRIYKELVSQRVNKQSFNKFNNGQRKSNFNMNSSEYPHLNGTANSQSNQNRYNVSFSETVKRSDSSENSRLDRLERMMENLMNMMSMIMTKLCN